MHKHNRIIKFHFSVILIFILVILFGSVFMLRKDVFSKKGLAEQKDKSGVILEEKIESARAGF